MSLIMIGSSRVLLFAVLSFIASSGWAQAVLTSSGLSDHPSPYLRSHLSDPIHWRPPESVRPDELSGGDIPILVSSGYLSCYWCHRFQQDTLQDAELAGLINESFIPVLLDREMHTEDDRILQSFLQDHVGVGGWPATAILTPEGVPVMAWTYVSGPVLRTALEKFSHAWRQDTISTRMLLASPSVPAAGEGSDASAVKEKVDIGLLLRSFLDQTAQVSDVRFGGFGSREKYPFAPQLLALLDMHQLHPSETMAAFLRRTLDSMKSGELLDPVEGGVFRYVENPDWSGPHFEQMLYTQALVAQVYYRASTALDHPAYASLADRILENMLERFSDSDGWFVSSLSATGTGGRNGAYYLVSRRDLAILLGESWSTMVEIRQQHDDLLLVAPSGHLAGISRQALKTLRSSGTLQRDDKKLLSWNGLVLSALSHGAGRLEAFRQAARELAEAIMNATDTSSTGKLAGVQSSVAPADLDSLVYAASGLFDWWQVTGEDRFLIRSGNLLETAVENFFQDPGWTRANTFLFHSPDRVRYIADDQLPSPTAVWFRLAQTLKAVGWALEPPSEMVSDLMAKGITQLMVQDAFFHPTQVSALVSGRILGVN